MVIIACVKLKLINDSFQAKIGWVDHQGTLKNPQIRVEVAESIVGIG